MELIVRKVVTVMTKHASGFSFKELHAANRGFIHRIGFAHHVLIEGGVGGDNRAFEGGNRIRNILEIDAVAEQALNCF